MKKLFVVVIVLAFCLSFSACKTLHGDISEVSLDIAESEKFDADEMLEAVTCVLKTFRSGWPGCKLTELRYVEAVSLDHSADMNSITFQSTFESGPDNGMIPSLNPLSTYTGWSWTLERADSSSGWAVVNYGLG